MPKSIIITQDIYNELEELESEDGDRVSEALVAYADSLIAAVADLSEHGSKDALSSTLLRDELDVELGAMRIAISKAQAGELDEDEIEDEIFYRLEEATQGLGDLLVPLNGAGDGYDADLELGRLSPDQLVAFDSRNPQVNLGGQRYSFADIPEDAR